MANKPLQSIKFPDLPDTYTIPVVDSTLAVSGAAADAKQTGDSLADKVDKVSGKGLSANDYTDEEKNKLSGIESGANKTVIDATLTQSGQAADAKVVGDRIGEIKDDLNNTLSHTRNIFDPSSLLKADGWTESNEEYQGNGTAINAKYGMNGVNYPLDATLEENTSYTISLLAKTNGNAGTSGTGLRIYLMYADGTNGSINIPNSTTTFTNFKLTSDSSKTLVGIRIAYGSLGDNIWHFKNIQLEKGAFQTEYIKDKVPNDQLAREDISAIKTALMTNYANAVMRTVASNATIHISDAPKVKTSLLVSVRSTNLLDPICKEYLYFEGKAGSYSIVSTGGKRANIVDVSNIDVLTISGDLSGFAGSLFRYAFTAAYPSAGVSTALGNGAVNTGTTIVVPNGAQYLIWITGTTSVDTITSNAMLNAGTEALAYTAYIADLPSVSVTIDEDGNGGNAQTYYANSNGDVVGFIVSNEFYAYSQSSVTIFITYVVDTEKAISEGGGGNGYTNLVGDGDTFSMTIGTDQSGALNNSRNIAIGNKNMKNATAIKCMTVGVENMGSVSGEQNSSFGYHSLFRVTSGRLNVAFGNESLDDTTEGNFNSGFGAYALQRNAKGTSNTAVGYQALRGGYNAFNQNAKYDYNTAVGSSALIAITTAYSNVAIGSDSGKTVTTGSSNTLIGTGADVSNGAIHDSIAIGKGAKALANNQMMLGPASITEVVFCGNKKINFNTDGTVTWETIT